jgi:hypothetical protein
MIDIFLSASVPLPSRNRQYFESADVLLIREALKALVEVVLPIGRITFGGHPAITPLIAQFVREAGLERDRLTVFQSRYFEAVLPKANAEFHNVRLIDAVGNDREQSLYAMRSAMILSRPFRSAVFIGGMEGLVAEAGLLRQLRPSCEIMPIASTGAAAAELFRAADFSADLQNELTYTTLFRRHFAQ